MKISTISRLTAAFALTALCACAQNGQDTQGNDTPQTLRDVEIPEDFTFATSRGVALTLAADATVLEDGHGALEVARADGRVLYRGPMAAGQPLTLNLAVPTKDDALKVKLSANGQELVGEASIAEGAATYSFQ